MESESSEFEAQQLLNTYRQFHNEKTSSYLLPKDNLEQERLLGQHFACKKLFGGNILSSVRESFDFNRGISVLDVGCGCGVWMMDMNLEFPNCSYYGCDIVDVTNEALSLNKFKFRYGNVVAGLPYEDNSFDLVHMRLLMYALRVEEWPIAINELLRVVKPNGLVQFLEYSCDIPKDKNTICYTTITILNSLSANMGQNPYIGRELEDLILASGKAKIIQSNYQKYALNSGTQLAREFTTNFLEGINGMMRYLGPLMNLNSEEEIADYMEILEHGILTVDVSFFACFISVKKIETRSRNRRS
ncbi:S-adenosyl-L-methionine-dependent methyltransferase [Sporodiniella umbellata]|nr:S-adenosyl-L-methionine-dependent methyltransferase [Sporodiniella umbellata]